MNFPKSHAFLLGTLYRQSNLSKNHDPDFVLKLENIVDLALAQFNEIILLGDFLSRKFPCNVTKQLKSLFTGYNFTQMIENPTRIVTGSSTLLDLIATNCPSVINSSGILPSSFGDDDMIYCVRKLHCKKIPAERKTFRSYVYYEPDKFCNELKHVNWEKDADTLGYQTESMYHVDQL